MNLKFSKEFFILLILFVLGQLLVLQPNALASCGPILGNPVITKTNATCNNNDGSLLVDITTLGGTGPYQLSLNGQTNTSGNFQFLGAGKYLLRVTDAANCSDSLFVTIASIGHITSPSINTFSPSTCNGIDGKIIVANTTGTGPFTYALSNGTTNSTGNFTSVAIGTYSMTITDGAGCTFKADGLTVKNQVFSGGSCNAGDDATIFEGESAYINGVGDGVVSWDPPKYLSDTSVPNPTATPPAGIHKYTIRVFNASTCTECTDEVIITVIPEISIPNTFTPNGDGDNDLWEINGLSTFDECELWIYTRWGQRIFHQNGYEEGTEWNGTYNGLSLPAATYYYVIDIKKNDAEGKPKKYAGSITIIK